MRVLISGVTSDLGRAFARAALGAGHELLGVGEEAHPDLPPGVTFTAGDAATAESLVAGTDVVVHLSPVERDVPGSGGIPALRRLSTAAARHGIRFVTPIVHGPDASDADKVVRDSGSQHVVIRTAPLGGRMLDWQACRTVATLLTAPKDTQWRLLHHDDLVRFLLHAVTSDRVGVVALAAPDILVAGAARDTLRGVAARGIPAWPAMSTSDRKGSARDWGFECGWSSEDVVADLARGARGRKLTKDGAESIPVLLPIPAHVLPRRRPPADGTTLTSVALPSMAVEMDDRIDPRYPVFAAQQTAELFPGSLTPLSIDVHTAGLRAAGRTLAQVLGLPSAVADEWASRGHAVFGHHLYAGVSALAAGPPPGWFERTVTDQLIGPRADADLFPLERPARRGIAARVSAWVRFAGMVRRYRASVRDFAATSAGERTADLATLPDGALAVRALLLRDRLAEGWTLTQLGQFVAYFTGAPLRKRAKADIAALGRGVDVEHEPVYPAVAGLAELLSADDELRALAEWGDVEAVRQKSPEFGAAFDEVLARIGHRGPCEIELSGTPFRQRPELVFAAALGAARRPKPEPEPGPAPETAEPKPEPAEAAPADSDTPGATPADAEKTEEDTAKSTPDTPARVKRTMLEKLAISGRRQRDTAVDATVRYTDELRGIVREWGARQVHAGRLVDVDDAFYLTLDELLTPPADALRRIERRRADRERLRQVRMPAVVSGSWRPEAAVDPAQEGKQLHGFGVSPGVVEGLVRILSDDRAEVEPGEVAVVRVADAGRTALFGPAAAIVTDLGGPLSRAAVVARELGIPCVTGARDASARLAPGTLVRVDGTTGDVAVLSPAPMSMHRSPTR
ncbi:MAG: PEP-utilizing enzyme [Actinophytocola sp.]|uniref:PEP-utilizing enzyme n=1 Tax=Actinophytocola sp. TaxID=1872138 RepID=UPI003C70BAB4